MGNFDIFDEIFIDKAERVFKVLILVAGLVITMIGISPKAKQNYEDGRQNNQPVKEGINSLLDSGLSVSDVTNKEKLAELSSNETAIYECLVSISKEYGAENLTVSEIQKLLTEEEKSVVIKVASSMKKSSVDYEKIRNDKAYRVDIFGMQGMTELYDIIIAHKKDFN